MEDYKLIYKCRLCGRRYVSGGIIESKMSLTFLTSDMNRMETVYPRGGGEGLNRLDVHSCNNGGIGVSDFLGFLPKKELEADRMLEDAGFD